MMKNAIKSFGAAGVFGLAILTTAYTAASGVDTAQQPAATVAAPKAELILVKYHADWCPNCNAMLPVWEQAKFQHAKEDSRVLFVKLDKTDKDDARQAELLSTELGLTEAWKSYGKRTGVMVLFNAQTHEVVREFTRTDSAADVKAAIAAAL